MNNDRGVTGGIRRRCRAGDLRAFAIGLPVLLALAGCADMFEGLTGPVESEPKRVSTGEQGSAEGYPSLASVPEQPPRVPSRQTERRQIEARLASDRANARYSGEPLRGEEDTEAAVTRQSDARGELPEPAELTPRQAGGSNEAGPSGMAQEEAPPGIPQIRMSRQGEPIVIPDMPAFSQGARAASRPGTAQSPGSAPRSGAVSGGAAAGAGERIAVIYFGHGSTALDERDRTVLRQVAEIQKAQGVPLRVVGHASSRTAAMEKIRHQMANFETSLKRAETVADALVSMGVRRDMIRVEARSDRDPVYHEFMDTGEAGNRRAEIFLDG